MPTKSRYRPYDLHSSSPKVFEVTQFKGVDYSSVKLNVSDEHAVDMLNIIYKDNVNQKRPGWEQVAKALPIEYYTKSNGVYTKKTNSTNVNGVWTFTAIDGNKYTIAHIGKLLFWVVNFGVGKTFLQAQLIPIVTKELKDGVSYNVALELEDYPSQAFYGSKRLYILGGNKYYVLRINNRNFELAEVEDDEETYIPTTTVAITYKDSAVNLAAPLDDVNMMTQFRKNKLVSGTYVDDGVTLRTTRFWDYELDTSVTPKNPTDINKIQINVDYLKEVV